MSENLEQTQSSQPLKEDDTQPIKPVRKPARWRSILIGISGFLLLFALGGFGGYSAGIGDRVSAQEGILTAQLAQQYQFALVDIQFGRFEAARQRLEYIIANDPNYPGATDLLTQTLVMSTIPTATPTVTLTPTPDFSGAESAYQRAQQLIAAQDWANALAALDTIRKLDPGYKTAQVDGMYYFALRNQGVNLITNQGNLEGGIYFLTLAERFGPLDNTANGLREGARLYITGASFWELDWMQAATYFTQVGGGWPSMYDGTMTGSQRLYIASMRYGDQLFENQQYCEAYEQYQVAVGIGQLQQPSAGNYNQAFIQCYPPTSTPEPTAIAPPETPTEVPTP
ncbi:MAG: hypothetical protein FJZ87_05120 [Chloroflexi bacterium]|nr:hypothetical protein [Chloroflexota bacterium]